MFILYGILCYYKKRRPEHQEAKMKRDSLRILVQNFPNIDLSSLEEDRWVKDVRHIMKDVVKSTSVFEWMNILKEYHARPFDRYVYNTLKNVCKSRYHRVTYIIKVFCDPYEETHRHIPAQLDSATSLEVVDEPRVVPAGITNRNQRRSDFYMLTIQSELDHILTSSGHGERALCNIILGYIGNGFQSSRLVPGTGKAYMFQLPDKRFLYSPASGADFVYISDLDIFPNDPDDLLENLQCLTWGSCRYAETLPDNRVLITNTKCGIQLLKRQLVMGRWQWIVEDMWTLEELDVKSIQQIVVIKDNIQENEWFYPRVAFHCGYSDGMILVCDFFDRSIDIIDHDQAEDIPVLIAENNGRIIAAGGMDETVGIWNTNTMTCEHVLEHGEYVNSVTALSDGRLLSACDYIKVWDRDTWTCQRQLRASEDEQYTYLACQELTHGQIAYLCDTYHQDGTQTNEMHVWCIDESCLIRRFPLVKVMTTLFDGRLLFAQEDKEAHHLIVYDPATRSCARIGPIPDMTDIDTLQFLQLFDGRVLLSFSGSIQMWHIPPS